MYMLNPTYFIYMLPAILLMMVVQYYVRSAYQKWSKVPSRSHMSGSQAAQRLIQRGGLYQVSVEGVAGNLTDHYDPRTKILKLSQGVYQGSSVASLAIAAHELGHAMQDQESYLPLRLRAALVPAVNIGSYLGWIFIILGFLLRFQELAWVGVIIFAGGAVFALATIPVELNASARAKRRWPLRGRVKSSDRPSADRWRKSRRCARARPGARSRLARGRRRSCRYPFEEPDTR